MISFSTHRADLTVHHLQYDIVDPQYRPSKALLEDHLRQGVWQFCRYPGWTKAGDHQCLTPLDPLSEDVEGLYSDYDEPQEAYAQINQFSMREMECGEGKAAFEDYLHIALSIRNSTVPML